MRFFTLFFAFGFLAFVSPVTAVKAQELPVDSEPYCNLEIKNKLDRMNPALDGVKKIVIIMDFLLFSFDEDLYDTPFHMKVFGETLKKSIQDKLKPIPKSEYDSETFQCYWRDNRPVEILYLGNSGTPLDSDKYDAAVKKPGNLIVYVKRHENQWAQKKRKNASRFGGLEDPVDTFSISAVLFRPDVHLDPKSSVLITFSGYMSDNRDSPDAELMSERLIFWISGGIFDSIR